MISHTEVDVNKTFFDGVFKDFGLKIQKEPRNWVNEVGIEPLNLANKEEFVRRVVFAASQEFNFWQSDAKAQGLNSSHPFKWIRDEVAWEDIPWNLLGTREKIRSQTEKFIWEWQPLHSAVEQQEFWIQMNSAFNLPGKEDPVFKKPILVKMILEDMGFGNIWKSNSWGFGCIDYNILIAFDYYGLIEIDPSIQKDKYYPKDYMDSLRKEAYDICYSYVSLGYDPSNLDLYLYLLGRKVRKKFGDELIPWVKNETNY